MRQQQQRKGPQVPQERGGHIHEAHRLAQESDERLLRSGRFWEGVAMAEIEAKRRAAGHAAG